MNRPAGKLQIAAFLEDCTCIHFKTWLLDQQNTSSAKALESQCLKLLQGRENATSGAPDKL